jgi:hypothetical protein
LSLAGGERIAIADTRKGELPGEIVHVPATGRPSTGSAAIGTCAFTPRRISCAR